MKKRFAIIGLSLIILSLLCGCITVSLHYAKYIESSMFEDNVSFDNSNIIICSNFSSFILNKQVERNLKESFDDLNVNSCILMSDYADVSLISDINEYVDLIADLAFQKNSKYYIEVSISDLYTYEIGGGVAKISLEACIYDLNNSLKRVGKIMFSSDSHENRYDSFNSSMSEVISDFASELYFELRKYK